MYLRLRKEPFTHSAVHELVVRSVKEMELCLSKRSVRSCVWSFCGVNSEAGLGLKVETSPNNI